MPFARDNRPLPASSNWYDAGGTTTGIAWYRVVHEHDNEPIHSCHLAGQPYDGMPETCTGIRSDLAQNRFRDQHQRADRTEQQQPAVQNSTGYQMTRPPR